MQGLRIRYPRLLDNTLTIFRFRFDACFLLLACFFQPDVMFGRDPDALLSHL